MNDITKLINGTIKDNYKKTVRKTAGQRYKGMDLGMNYILDIMYDKYRDDAKSYYLYRTKFDKKYKYIQNNVIKQLNENFINFKNITYDIIPASSFSAKTNLVPESDIDLVITINKLTNDRVILISNILGLSGFTFLGIKNQNDPKIRYWTFQKYIEDIEIELKLTDFNNFKDTIKIHNYLDNILNKNDKILITYLKYLIKDNKILYNKFKLIYYTSAAHNIKLKKIIYKLV